MMTPKSRAEVIVNVATASTDAAPFLGSVVTVYGVMFGDVWLIAPGGKEDAERCCANIREMLAYAIDRAEDRGRDEKR